MVFVSIVIAIYLKGSLSPGVAALAINYSLNITSILNLFLNGYNDMETNFISIERVVEYSEVDIEVNRTKIDIKFALNKS